MEDTFVIEHIRQLCNERNWSIYKLAKEAGMNPSNLSYMLNRSHIPTMHNLIKICNGFGISLSQFFSGMEQESQDKNSTTQKFLNIWNKLDKKEKELVLVYMYGLAHINPPSENEFEL